VRFAYASWAGYLQDEWKLSPTVTLIAGLRYDYVTQPHTLDGRLWNSLDLDDQRYIIGAKTMPPLCSLAQQAPCIPDGFVSDPFASHVVLAGKSFFAPPRSKTTGRRASAWHGKSPQDRDAWRLWSVLDSITARSQYAQNDLEAMCGLMPRL